MNLTPEQESIVRSDAGVVFVAAAAGSGKTRLLVERYLRAVLDEGLRPESVPTVTFTRKAAGEIRRRIRSELLAAGRADLAWSLDDAPIGTIHSLCSRLLRSNRLDADVDPAFTVLEEDQADMLAAEAFSRAWEGLVLASSSEQRVLLARHQSCLEEVRSAYDKLRQEGEEQPVLRMPAAPDPEAARAVLVEVLAEVCGGLVGVALGGRAAANLEKAQACDGWLVGARPTWEDLEAGAAFTPHLGCGAATKEAFARVKEALQAFRDALAANYLMEVLALADSLMRRFHALYREEKRLRGVLDFADLELGARRLLLAGARPFGEGSRLMVDEFQDTNGLQCDILERLGTHRRLTVGDPYQSIYAFRGADVGVFRDRHATLGDTPGDDTLVASLSTNYRSRAPLLEALNHIFGHEGFFGEAFPALLPPDTATAQRAAEAATEAAAGEGLEPPLRSMAPSVEVVVVEASGEESGEVSLWDLESAVVAERVDTLLRNGRAPRDIVILLRAFTHVSEFESALRARSIPVYVVEGRGFFAREELQDVKALLRILLNPHDDPALLTVLRSPVVGLPDDVALMLRMDADAAGHRFLWEVVRGGDYDCTAPEYRDALQRTAAALGGLRSRLGAPGLPALIEDALAAFDYDLVLLASPDGLSRFANVRKLVRLAGRFEAVEGPDLGGFLAHLDTRGRLRGDREAGASILSEEEDVVRVMTIHKAKGLEFPVVVVAGMGSGSRSGRETGPLEVSRGRVGLRVKAPSGKRDDRLVLGPYAELEEKAARVAEEETGRLHYVAATRAREHLLLVGAVKAEAGIPAGAPLAPVLRSLGCEDRLGGDGGPVRPVEALDLTVERVVAGGRAGSSGVLEAGALVPGLADRATVHAGVISPRRDAPNANAPSPAGAGGIQGEVDPPAAESPASRVEPPAFPDLGRVVPGVRRTSFTALRRFEECPRAYYLERVLGLGSHLFEGTGRRAFDPGEADAAAGAEAHDEHTAGPLGREIGTAVHRVLESIDLGARPAEQEVVAALSSPGPGEEPLTGAALECAARLVLAFWDSPYASAVGRGVVSRERPFRFAHEGVVVSGFLDLVVESDDGRWLVVDYKTNRLDGSDPATAFAPYELQGQLYALAALVGGAREVEVAFLFLEEASAPVSRTYRPDDMAGLRSVLSSRLGELKAGRFPGKGVGCETCPTHGFCQPFAV